MGSLKIPFTFEHNTQRQAGLENVIKEALTQSDKVRGAICLELVQNHRANGAPSIGNFNVAGISFINQHSGKLTVDYLVDVTFGCEDITNQYRSTDTLNFEIDLAGKTITLNIPEYPVRDTADEF